MRTNIFVIGVEVGLVESYGSRKRVNHDTHLPTFPIAHMSKKMSSCQKAVKLSKRCQMSKSQTHGLWRRFTKKNKLT